VKKLVVRKPGSVRLTSAASPLYGSGHRVPATMRTCQALPTPRTGPQLARDTAGPGETSSAASPACSRDSSLSLARIDVT
jgi:hypothetical protein